MGKCNRIPSVATAWTQAQTWRGPSIGGNGQLRGAARIRLSGEEERVITQAERLSIEVVAEDNHQAQ